MEKIKKIKIKPNIVENIFKDMSKNYKEIVKDYIGEFNKKDIEKSFLKQRLLGRFLTFRTLNNKNFKPLLKAIEKKIKKKIFLSPLYYIRICPPNLMYGKGHRKAFLYTEPHYDGFDYPDKSYGVWVPLQKTTTNTGTLSYIKKNDKIRKLFPNEGKNRFNIKNYIKEYSNVDNALSKSNRPIHCDVGDILIFDGKTLHAATHPINQSRLSLNFQITFESKNKVLKNKKFYFTNKNFEEKNLINLKFMGDKKFFTKRKKIYDKKLLENNTSELTSIYKKLKLKKINLNSIKEDVHWTKEDQWVKLIN